jgi:hypothetical protein
LPGVSKLGVEAREESHSEMITERLGSPVEADERIVYERILGEDAFSLRIQP